MSSLPEIKEFSNCAERLKSEWKQCCTYVFPGSVKRLIFFLPKLLGPGFAAKPVALGEDLLTAMTIARPRQRLGARELSVFKANTNLCKTT